MYNKNIRLSKNLIDIHFPVKIKKFNYRITLLN